MTSEDKEKLKKIDEILYKVQGGDIGHTKAINEVRKIVWEQKE